MTDCRMHTTSAFEVVSVDLDELEGDVGLLSNEERTQASRFRFAKDRARFIKRRTLLRKLLAERLALDPGSVDLATSPHGKPYLNHHAELSFNMTHSSNLALFAFSKLGDVGVDIEKERGVDTLGIARGCFSDLEQDELLSLAPSQRVEAFFHGWVQKEAVVKADGRGMSLTLQTFSVRLTGEPELIEAPASESPVEWDMFRIDVGRGAKAAVALRLPSRREGYNEPRAT